MKRLTRIILSKTLVVKTQTAKDAELLSTIDRKQALRAEMKARRAAVSLDERQRSGKAVVPHIGKILDEANPDNIGLYYPVQTEFDSLPLALYIENKGFELSLPVVTDKQAPLVFRPWKTSAVLHKGAFNINEPQDNGLSVCPEMLIIPLLVFDEGGSRLGYGGGFYDRTLEKLRAASGTIGVGLAYDFQEVHSLPVGPHDQLLDFILTPSGLRKF